MLSQRQIQKMRQILSPQQIQMIKLLELPMMQLEQRIKQEIEENPVLDEEVTEEKNDEEPPKEISVEEYLREDETPSYKYNANNYSRDDRHRPLVVADGRSLHEYLMEQLGYKHLSQREELIAKYLVGSIDEDGYLRRDMNSIADDIAFGMGIETTREELEQVVHVIHELEPSGIGARSLQECLLLQLDASPARSTTAGEMAYRILSTYFEEFSKKHFEKIMNRMGIDSEMFREAISEITRLSPKPGNLYGEGHEVAPYIVPDFILENHDGQLDLRLNSHHVPELKINRKYAEMIREMASHGGTENAQESEREKEALQFVKNKIESAKWFISAIRQRHDTLMHTMQEILDYQQEYFLDGEKSKLRPMILKDIADRTDLDVSTISRVVNSKYIQTPFGVILLKELFSEAMKTDSGEEVSSYEIKNILTESIANEDKRKPLTDEVLMEILNSRGYQIARRTVAKYREMLWIPVARLRREI